MKTDKCSGLEQCDYFMELLNSLDSLITELSSKHNLCDKLIVRIDILKLELSKLNKILVNNKNTDGIDWL